MSSSTQHMFVLWLNLISEFGPSLVHELPLRPSFYSLAISCNDSSYIMKIGLSYFCLLADWSAGLYGQRNVVYLQGETCSRYLACGVQLTCESALRDSQLLHCKLVNLRSSGPFSSCSRISAFPTFRVSVIFSP